MQGNIFWAGQRSHYLDKITPGPSGKIGVLRVIVERKKGCFDVHLEQGPRPCMCAKTYFCIVHFKLAPTLLKICDNIQLDNDKILKMQYLIIIFGTNSIPLVFTQCPKERLSGISFSDDTYL